MPPERRRQIFVSYAWGDTAPAASKEDRQRQAAVERLCEALEKEPWQVVLDKSALRYGERISSFMKQLASGNLIIVVLSAKYLRSPYCLTELYNIYERSRREKEDFLWHIIPIVLADAHIDSWRDRVTCARHWEAEFKAMEKHFTNLGEEDLKLYKAMKRWHSEVGDMLAYVNDALTPHGFDEIVKDDFAALRQMLWQRR